MDNQQPDESISNRSSHVHHYVLKGSGGSCYAECDVEVGNVWDGGPAELCGEKLSGDGGPVVGSRAKVEAAITDA